MDNIMKSMLAMALGLGLQANAANAPAADWKTVSCGDNSTYAINSDGTLWGWGDNENGQLALADGQKFSAVPVMMSDATDWAEVYGARGAAFFLKEDGTLWTVGSNENGMSGTGDGLTNHKEIVQVGTDSDWASVGASINWCYTVLAIKTDGSLWAWGDGMRFCLGQGDTNSLAVPTRIGEDNDWKSVSIGNSHVLALKEDGSLWGWGFAPYKQLMNDETNVRIPTRLGNDTWTAVYAIDNASYGLKADGTLWGWGDNQRNLLGFDDDMTGVGADDVLDCVQYPAQITSLPGKVLTMSGCENVRVVILEGGKVMAWGANANGSLGDGKGEAYEAGNNQYVYTPVEVALPEGSVAKAVASGQRFSAALLEDNQLYGWGSNRWGQMGNFADDSQLTFEPLPIVMAMPAPPTPGEYTFDAQSIPSSLADAVKIKMTGEWKTSDLQKLCIAIGANLGFPPVGNKTLKSVDMSEATFAPNTSFYVAAGMQNAGIFKMCKELESVKFPTNETVANITSLREAFMNCNALTTVDVSGLTGVTDLTNAFYATSVTMVNMAEWGAVTKSEDAFGKCASLNTVILPADFYLGKYVFNSCTALRLIDWSLYAGEEAPVVASDAKIFQDLTAEEQALITVMVPEEVYESFKADATWEYVTLQPVEHQEEGTYTVEANNIPSSLADAVRINLTGSWTSDAFKNLSNALGNNSGSGNSVLRTVDMSKAEIAVGTNLSAQFPGALWGTVTKGVFQACKALEQVIMPEAEQAANFRSFENAFYGCVSLTEIDLSGLTGLNNTIDAFYNCENLATVVLPGNFEFGKECFDRCNALTSIDWTRFEGTEAPAFRMNSLPARGKDLTITVPLAAFDSFVADESWNSYNIVAGPATSVDTFLSVPASDSVYTIDGRCLGNVSVKELPAGLYIIAGKKVLVK